MAFTFPYKAVGRRCLDNVRTPAARYFFKAASLIWVVIVPPTNANFHWMSLLLLHQKLFNPLYF